MPSLLLSIEDRGHGVVAEVAAADEPLVVLFNHDAGGEPDQKIRNPSDSTTWSTFRVETPAT